jgi:hypothetical protein
VASQWRARRVIKASYLLRVELPLGAHEPQLLTLLPAPVNAAPRTLAIKDRIITQTRVQFQSQRGPSDIARNNHDTPHVTHRSAVSSCSSRAAASS